MSEVTEMIYVFIADGFEEVEAIATVDMLRRCGIDTITVGIGSQMVIGSHNMGLVCDVEDKFVQANNSIDAVVLPGGMPGTTNLENSEKVQSFIDFAVENDRYICAICAAPSILGHKGLLDGKKATSFPSFSNQLGKAEYTDELVTIDGKIITAKGAGAAWLFGKTIAQEFVGKEKAEEVYDSIQHE